jgi:hypothetical protein
MDDTRKKIIVPNEINFKDRSKSDLDLNLKTINQTIGPINKPAKKTSETK